MSDDLPAKDMTVVIAPMPPPSSLRWSQMLRGCLHLNHSFESGHCRKRLLAAICTPTESRGARTFSVWFKKIFAESSARAAIVGDLGIIALFMP